MTLTSFDLGLKGLVEAISTFLYKTEGGLQPTHQPTN